MKVSTLYGITHDLVRKKLKDRLQGITPWLRSHAAAKRRAKEPVEIEAPTPQIVRAFRKFSRWGGIIAMLVGYHVLLGWMFEIPILKSPSRSFADMQLNSALCSILAGAALCLLQTRGGRPTVRGQIFADIFGGFMAIVALLTITEYVFGLGLGIDLWLPNSVNGATEASLPGRMAFTSALAFLMIGAAIVLQDKLQNSRAPEFLALTAAAISLVAIAGYLYEASAFQGRMPLYESLVIFFTAGGILCARPDRGLMAKVTSNSFGGIMARRLLPATLLIPLAVGWLEYAGHRAGFYSAEPGLALFAVANVLVFLGVIWWGVNSLHRMDTKRRQAEQELQETAAKLTRSNADLEQFAYVASHDLKEPLRAISGSVQILQERYRHCMDDGADEVIKHTVDGATRMQTLIDDLLTYARLTTREVPLEPADCAQLVREALTNLQIAIKESKAVVIQDALPVVRGDRTQLLQLLQNLISNAIKYRSDRTPKIHVGVEDKDGEWLFFVRDNGIGIAPQYASRIFRIFQRLHTRQEYPGTGIGLAVCKTIVERHGGRIWVESEPEEGSTFFFTLPKA
jgi:signal transduction histidine kinase